MPASNHHSDNGLARGLMKKLTSDQPSCFSIRPKRRDCSKIHLVKIIALYENNNDSKRKERILVDVATDPHWIEACRDEEDYDVEVMDIKPEHDFDTVRIVFEHYLDRNDANLGYDMWFDDFQHGYGRCKTMRCGEFAPPLLKGAGAAYGHDVGEPNTCSDGDKVGSKCAMNCPATHPVHHFSHYWQEINCLPGGFWSQDLYTYYTGYCSAPACNFFDVVPPENGWYSCTAQGYEGSICTFGCNSVDFKLQDKDPYRIQCQSGMWEPVGGSKKFVQGKVHPKCVFNHVFARREKKITKLLNPLHAMKREYRELSGADFPSELRHKQTEYNVQLVKRRFSMNDATKAIDFERIFNSEMKVVDFESDSEVFEG